jgi:hypothetical protein
LAEERVEAKWMAAAVSVTTMSDTEGDAAHSLGGVPCSPNSVNEREPAVEGKEEKRADIRGVSVGMAARIGTREVLQELCLTAKENRCHPVAQAALQRLSPLTPGAPK